ncbi:AAA family ATPase [Aeromonas hydrophila]|uniref:AAA family ATPase n=1 Tax=Aeromonas hydrophila TaxID=644 RepID=UPI0009BB7195|nr:AAA family ATPase [Aeromonas hydrophila]HAT2248407.1 AAA family ATPase [Aeromonas hydrophila]HAT2383822.1 AAA family ATPase [Aeromonas hydrophila]HAT2415865.1 AAA family ATPase [Aeromonas hydrophila]HAT2526855.1 AAA family ATPase [Aeromonas hydrophila]HAT2546826.1 AAA family ATPase [Aeromonas hydrophila]
MKVKNLRLLHFRGIKDLYVDITQNTTAFVGINGVGKSTILDALAIALSQLMWRLNGSPQKSRQIAPDDIQHRADFARIELTIELQGVDVKWATVTNRKKGTYTDPLRKSDLDALNEMVRQINIRSDGSESDEQSSCSLPLAVYYDVNRAALDIPIRIREKLKNSSYEVYRDALDHGGADFKRFFIWFRNCEDYENEQRRDNPNFRDRSLEAVRSAISVFTAFENLRIRRSPLRMTVMKQGIEFNVSQLSDGERNMLALVGDLARRLSILNPILQEPNHGAGVVIIDEIDLHLHPGWQRDVVAKLEKTFPHCQLFISTHSPQVVGELQPESVMLLHDGRLLGHALRSIGLSSSEILEELMNGKARNVNFQEIVRNVERSIEDEEYDSARIGLASLRENFGNLPEVLRLEENLEWFYPTQKIDSSIIDSGDE